MLSVVKKIQTYAEKSVDGYTMYKVVSIGLALQLVWAFGLAFLGYTSFSAGALLASAVTIVGISVLVHYVLARATLAPAHIESTYITALILVLIVQPTLIYVELAQTALFACVAVLSKYILVYKHRHLFNPVALSLFVCGLLGMAGGLWWVGSVYMLVPVTSTALVVILKTRRYALVATFLMGTIACMVLFSMQDPVHAVKVMLLSYPILFFAAFMLTEPLGLPATTKQQVVYGASVALVAGIPWHWGALYSSLELGLLLANAAVFFYAWPIRARLQLVQAKSVGGNCIEYSFKSDAPVLHKSGQYMEWTLPHAADTRGERRYLSIASGENTEHLSFAIKHVENESSWKRELRKSNNHTLYATQVSGDFIPSEYPVEQIWIAGGIGITPFISVLRTESALEKIPRVTLLYCCAIENDIAFKEELDRIKSDRIKVHYVLANPHDPTGTHETGFVTYDLLEKLVPHWQTHTFFISGPPSMVSSYTHLITENNVPAARVFTDYFPGLA
jgi:glycine betaine catabolism B